jgi:putative salt-induced outer membrane protein YdiY
MLSTCSLKGGWKAHKIQCKIAAQSVFDAQPRAAPVGSFTQLNELLRVGAKYTIYADSMALGLGFGRY